MIRDDKDIENLLIATTELLSDYHFEETQNSLIKALEDDPKNLDAHYTLGIMYAKREEYDKALKHLNKIDHSKVEYPFINHARTVIAYIYVLNEKYVKAKEILMKILEIEKNDEKALSILAFIFYRAKLYEQALKLYERMLNNDPVNSKILNNIGFILIETRININKGMVYINKALRITPDQPSYLDSLGWGYYYTGDYEKAVETLKKAFELQPNSAEIKAHIREVLNIGAKSHSNY